MGVDLYQNEEENFFNRTVKSELDKIAQGRHRNLARNSADPYSFLTFVCSRQPVAVGLIIL